MQAVALWSGGKDTSKSMAHALNPKLIALQAEAIGVPIIQQKTTWETYEAEFKQAIEELKQKGILPLWKLEPERILRDFVGLGFEAIIVCTKEDLMGKEWLGKKIDTEIVEKLLRLENIHPCGESGEYHTFVIDGPIFKQRLQILDAKPVQREKYWFLNIPCVSLVKKDLSQGRLNGKEMLLNPRWGTQWEKQFCSQACPRYGGEGAFCGYR